MRLWGALGFYPGLFHLRGRVAAKHVVAFVDGFNLYHAIKDLGQNELRWLDIRKLCSFCAPAPKFQLEDVYYFSAYATWLPDSYRRHPLTSRP